MPQVQQELKISSEQKELLESLQADLFYQVRSTFRGGFRPPNSPRNAPQNRRQLQDSLRNRFTKLGEQGDDLLKTILEPDQTERLEQLRLQREGARAFDREEFVKAIGLDETQRKEIRELRDAATQRTRQQRRPTGEQEKAIAAMLTDQQKDQWDAMKGEPFKFPPRRSRFGRRGGGRGEGNRNRPQRPGPDE